MPDPSPGRRRRPGLAVLIVLLYGLLFLAGLLLLRAHSPLYRRNTRPTETPISGREENRLAEA